MRNDLVHASSVGISCCPTIRRQVHIQAGRCKSLQTYATVCGSSRTSPPAATCHLSCSSRNTPRNEISYCRKCGNYHSCIHLVSTHHSAVCCWLHEKSHAEIDHHCLLGGPFRFVLRNVRTQPFLLYRFGGKKPCSPL